ncbi:MAG: DUF308 domain-containing protein [Firmicutes bacterium]|nr:DUF308 domain-containing protein [Bacillota bacterium]
MTEEKKHEIPVWRIIFSGATLTALAYIIVGVVLIVWPEITYTSLCYVAATAVMIIGLIDVIRYILRGISEGRLNNYLSRGLILVIISAFMFVRNDYVEMVLPTMLGLAILIDGIIKLQRSVDLIRLKDDGWIFVLILAVLAILSGAILVFRPLDGTRIVTAIALIYCGVTSMVVSIFVHAKLRKYREKLTSGEIDERPVRSSEEIAQEAAAAAAAQSAESAEAIVEGANEAAYTAQAAPAIEAAPIPALETAPVQPIPEQPVPETPVQTEVPFDSVLPEEEELEWHRVPTNMAEAAMTTLEMEEEMNPLYPVEEPLETEDGDIPFEKIEI